MTSEGSLLLNVQELATAAHTELPVKIVVLDNGALGMVRQQQDMFWDGRRSASALGGALDWELVARGFGVAVRSVDHFITRASDADWSAVIGQAEHAPDPGEVFLRRVLADALTGDAG